MPIIEPAYSKLNIWNIVQNFADIQDIKIRLLKVGMVMYATNTLQPWPSVLDSLSNEKYVQANRMKH